MSDIITKINRYRNKIIKLAGYYKPSETEVYDEGSPGGNFDFLSKLCTDWESAAKLRPDTGVRQVTIR